MIKHLSAKIKLNEQINLNEKIMIAETRDYSELMLASSPDLNQGPSDLQSDALPTELSRQLRTLKLQGPAGL